MLTSKALQPEKRRSIKINNIFSSMGRQMGEKVNKKMNKKIKKDLILSIIFGSLFFIPSFVCFIIRDFYLALLLLAMSFCFYLFTLLIYFKTDMMYDPDVLNEK